MDTVVYGSINAKMAYIISAKSAPIAEKLLEMNLGRKPYLTPRHSAKPNDRLRPSWGAEPP